MAIGAIKLQATVNSSGFIKINKRGNGDPTGLDKGDSASFDYIQGGGSSQPPVGEWVKVAIKGTRRTGYSANGNLVMHDCPARKKKTTSKRATQPDPTRKGIIVVKNQPDYIQGHPSSGLGTIPADTNTIPDGNFVTFQYDAATGKAKNIAVHTCPHSAK